MSTWLAILDIAAARTTTSFGTIDDVTDDDMMLLVDATVSVLSLSRDDAFTAFVRGLVDHYSARTTRISGTNLRAGADVAAPESDLDMTG